MSEWIQSSVILEKFKSHRKQLAVLIDPDKAKAEFLDDLITYSYLGMIDFFFVGGSLLELNYFSRCIEYLKSKSEIPVVIFPGSSLQVSNKADAILFLSLISGRNPELLIGEQIKAAPAVFESGIETIGTGYILVDGGNITTAQYISQTLPVPHNKPGIAATISMTAEMMGFKCVYLDTGSGALRTVSPQMIEAVKKKSNLPIIVGGGIRDTNSLESVLTAGADVAVIGTVVENNSDILPKMHECLKELSYKI